MKLRLGAHELFLVLSAVVLAAGCGGPQEIDPSQQLLIDLTEGDSDAKIRAAAEIAGSQGTLLTPEIVKALFELVRTHEDANVRIAAVRGLRGVGHGSLNELIGIRNSEKDKKVQFEIEQLIKGGGGAPTVGDPGGGASETSDGAPACGE